MFKNVLVLLDGSSLALEVLPAVERLMANTSGSNLTLLRVEKKPHSTVQVEAGGAASPAAASGASSIMRRQAVEPTPPSYAEDPGQAAARREQEVLADLADAAKALMQASHNVHFAVRFGDPVPEIEAFVREGGFDLIAMATHGQSGLKAIVQGSVTAAVIRSGIAPVLVVRPG